MTSFAADGFRAHRNTDIAGHLRQHRAALFWPLALVAVLTAHLAAGWWLIAMRSTPPMDPQPSPAILLDLAPAPSSAPMPQQPQKPVPPVFQTMPQPPAPEITPEKPLPQVPAEVALPQQVKKVIKPVVKPKLVKTETPLSAPTPPMLATPRPTATAAPMTPPVDTAAQQQKEAALAAASLAAKSNWFGAVVQHIATFKRQPRARLRGPLRTIVSFEISRDGKLLSPHVLQSSGRDEIDDEALAWIQRADPMPKPPGEISDADLSHGFTIPVDFTPPR